MTCHCIYCIKPYQSTPIDPEALAQLEDRIDATRAGLKTKVWELEPFIMPDFEAMEPKAKKPRPGRAMRIDSSRV